MGQHGISDQKKYSPEEVSRLGEDFYFKELKENLEKTNKGEYVVIEVESKKYFINRDLLKALEDAKREFPERIFHIIQIGTLQKSSINFKDSKKYAWVF